MGRLEKTQVTLRWVVIGGPQRAGKNVYCVVVADSVAGNQTLGNTVGLGRVGVQLEEVGLRSNLRRFHFLLNLAYGPEVAVLNFSGSRVSGFCCPPKPYNIKIVQS